MLYRAFGTRNSREPRLLLVAMATANERIVVPGMGVERSGRPLGRSSRQPLPARERRDGDRSTGRVGPAGDDDRVRSGRIGTGSGEGPVGGDRAPHQTLRIPEPSGSDQSDPLGRDRGSTTALQRSAASAVVQREPTWGGRAPPGADRSGPAGSITIGSMARAASASVPDAARSDPLS